MPGAENINPAILSWARETAGLSIEEAAKRLGLTDSKRGTAAEKLATLEHGDQKPTRIQLLKFATVYRRPLTTFYMANHPAIRDGGEDFRTISGPVEPQESALLNALLRNIRARHDMVRSILEDEDDLPRLAFVGSLSIDDPVQHAAQLIRDALSIADDRELRRGTNTPDDLFAKLRSRVEEIGVFVLLAGNLGTHHSNISERVFRGFAIADDLAPFIVINDQDAKAARSFTLIHELSHIFLGFTGISGAPSTIEPRSPIARVERFCNDVAGEFLLPEAAITTVGFMEDVHAAMDVAHEIADQWKVSEAMVAHPMDLGRSRRCIGLPGQFGIWMM